jgi:hypothetical protein
MPTIQVSSSTPTSEPSATPEPSATSTPNPADEIRQRISAYNNPELDALMDHFNGAKPYTLDDTELTGNITSNLYRQTFDFAPVNFLAVADVDYGSASNSIRQSSTGCGYVFSSYQDWGNYILFTLDKEVRLTLSYSGKWDGMAHHKDTTLDLPSPNGKARILLAVEDKHLTFAVNGKIMLDQDVTLGGDFGNFGYALLAGTNKDYGTRCSFTNSVVLVNSENQPIQ